MANIKQSGPDSGLGFQKKSLNRFGLCTIVWPTTTYQPVSSSPFNLGEGLYVPIVYEIGAGTLIFFQQTIFSFIDSVADKKTNPNCFTELVANPLLVLKH